MSTDSLAMLRRHAGDDLAELAQEHLQHDLTEADRDVLHRAAKQFSVHTVLGSLAGVGLGVWLFVRTRSARQTWMMALNSSKSSSSGAGAVEKPVEVRFQSGRVEPLPDITKLIQTNPWTDAAAGMLFAAGGLFLGGEFGMMTGSWSARRSVTADPDRKARIENAFRRYHADVLRRQAQKLEAEADGKGLGILESAKSVVGWR